MLTAIDLETKCALGCKTRCEHALDPYRNEITCIGVWSPDFKKVFRIPEDFARWIESFDAPLCGHNLKWDLKVLKTHGIDVPLDRWQHDSQILASACPEKISPEFMVWYEKEREVRNKALPKGFGHRNAGILSLKTLAPYFLAIPAFWENPCNHDDDEYVLRDCEYSHRLVSFFLKKLEDFGCKDFYERHLFPWTKMLLRAELRGVKIDLHALEEADREAKRQADAEKVILDGLWEGAYDTYFKAKRDAIEVNYRFKCDAAVARLKKKKKAPALRARYEALKQKALGKIPSTMNLDSPQQLSWILRDYLKLDIRDFDEAESTGKEVLNRLAADRPDIQSLLRYRSASKLAQAFFPSYRDMQQEGVIHTTFNSTGTRTGRLSSSHPNLQQVPGSLHKLFIARPGKKFVTKDLAAIEPCVVAYYTEDRALCELLINGGNFHSFNAKVMLGLDCPEEDVAILFPKERKLAKTCGLALMYGAGPRRIQATALQFGWFWSLAKCKEIYANFKAAYPDVFLFKEELDRRAVSKPIVTAFKRMHLYPDPNDIMMQAFNTLIQSTASDMMMHSSYRAAEEFEALGVDAYPLLWVHDEVVFEVPEERAEECEQTIEAHLTRHGLDTQWGKIPVKAEGATAVYWTK